MNTVKKQMNCRLLNEFKDERVIIGISLCPYTQSAVDCGFTDNIVFLDKCLDGETQKQALISQTAQRSVPYVFDKGEFIGGWTELKQYMKTTCGTKCKFRDCR